MMGVCEIENATVLELLVDRVKAVNPQVNDPDFIIAGDKLRFPDASQGQPAQPAGGQER